MVGLSPMAIKGKAKPSTTRAKGREAPTRVSSGRTSPSRLRTATLTLHSMGLCRMGLMATAMMTTSSGPIIWGSQIVRIRCHLLWRERKPRRLSL
ncbi:hypothetical protein BJX62DRAFT_200023 [Aspergillus germanicus]